MTKKPAKKQETRTFGRYIGLSLLLVSITCAVAAQSSVADPILGFLIVFAIVYFATFLGALGQGQFVRGQMMPDREHRRQLRRQYANQKAAASLKAQLGKPDFETRLESFVKAEKAEIESEEGFVSKMEFWQKDDSYSRTPTRPVELLRQLLQHIAKLVGRS